jgi:structural maintenance of chromosome 2
MIVKLPISLLSDRAAKLLCIISNLYLTQVVVENEVVAAQLIEKGKLRRRFTMVPLNKIRPFVLADEVSHC